MAINCQWNCACWDCATDRRNTIRFAVMTCLALAVAGGLFVVWEARSALDDAAGDEDGPRVSIAMTS